MELFILYYDDGEWEDVVPFSNLEAVINYLRKFKKLCDDFHVEKYILKQDSGEFKRTLDSCLRISDLQDKL